MLAEPPLDAAARASVAAEARALVTRARELKRRKGVMESFLEEFGLSNAEGLALMCLAEALLRVPDEETADKLIAEKISTGRWGEHLGKSDHWLVNAGTWGLMLTGAHRRSCRKRCSDDAGALHGQPRRARRASRSCARAAMQAMRILGEQFVLGRTIDAAMKRGAGMKRGGLGHALLVRHAGRGRAHQRRRRALSSRATPNAIDAVGADAADGRGRMRRPAFR